MKKLATTVALGALLATTGCYKVTYVAKSRTPSATTTEKGMSFFFWGLAGTGEVHTNQMCPGGAARVRTQQGALDMFLGIITLGIYAPRTAVVTCAQQ